ncbi:M3 family metallopeptidase, partial [Escherichia coli]
MAEILDLRQEEARLLGYASFAEVSLVPKMADSPTQVIAFLRDLARRARPYAEQDVADLRALGAQQYGLQDPQPWDWSFLSERLKEAR